MTEKNTDDDDDGWNDNNDGDDDNIDEIDDKNDQKHIKIMTFEYKLTNFRAYYIVKERPKNSGRGLPPPWFGQCPKVNILFYRKSSLTMDRFFCSSVTAKIKTRKEKLKEEKHSKLP